MKHALVLFGLILCMGSVVLAQVSTTTSSSATGGRPFQQNTAAPGFTVSNKLSYQGLLTTSAGVPVSDGSYNIKFDIYNLPAAGTLRHTETINGVAVSKGTFSVMLHPSPAIFAESLFVEVTALSGPGIGSPLTFSPRSELTSAPYAFAPWITDMDTLSVTGKSVGIGTTSPVAPLDVESPFGYVTQGRFGWRNPLYMMCDNAMLGFNIYYSGGFRNGTTGYGGATISFNQEVGQGLSFNIAPPGPADNLASLSTAMAIANNGRVGIGTVSPSSKLEVNGDFKVSGSSGNSSVVLPNDAISASEILDEPGISVSLGNLFVFPPVGGYIVLDSVDITLPAGGYVVLTGGGYVNLYHTNGTTTEVWVGINKTRNTVVLTNGSAVHSIPSPTPTSLWQQACSVSRSYTEVAAGTYRYYLNMFYKTGPSSSTNFAMVYLSATYYPTAYGTITAASQGTSERPVPRNVNSSGSEK